MINILENKDAKVIVIGNQKGGCSKTTSSVHIACGLANKSDKPKVLMIDADSQKSSSIWAENREKFNFDIILSNDDMIELIDQNLNKYDYIIIDCPPATDKSEESLTTYNSLLMADLTIIPFVCSPLDLLATENFADTVDNVLTINKKMKVFILLSKYKPRLKMSKRMINQLKEEVNYPFLKNSLADRIVFIESAEYGKTVFEFDDQKAINEVNNLTDEILTIFKGTWE